MPYQEEGGILKLKQMQVDMRTPISADHEVYEGRYGDQIAAIKVLELKKSGQEANREKDRISNEVDTLISLGLHDNTTKYVGNEWIMNHDVKKLYIAMERCCSGTLEDAVAEIPSESVLPIWHHIAKGIKHIHDNGIIHRTLKPRHILLSLDKTSIKICGFGRSRGEDDTIVSSAKSFADEYTAPEVTDNSSIDRSIDIYSAGLIFMYIWSKGACKVPEDNSSHFWSQDEGESSNYSGIEVNLRQLLIKDMTNKEPLSRPTIDTVLRHPVFWNSINKLEFREALIEERKLTDIELLKNLDYSYDSDEAGAALLFALCRPQQNHEGEHILPAYCRPEISKETKEVIDGFRDTLTEQLERILDLGQINFEKREIPVPENTSSPESREHHDIIDIGDFKIKLCENVKPKKAIFKAQGQHEGQHAVVAKLVEVENTSFLDPLKKVGGQDHFTRLWKSSEIFIPMSSICSITDTKGKRHFAVVIDQIAGQSIEQVLAENVSLENRRMLALHFLYAMVHLHKNNIVHGNLIKEKLLLGKPYLKLLLSRETKIVANRDGIKDDITKVIELIDFIFIYGHDEQIELKLFEHLKQSEVGDVEDIIYHPYFWKANKKLDLIVQLAKYLESQHEITERDLVIGNSDSDWSAVLKLRANERKIWGTHFESIVYDMSQERASGNSKYKLNSSIDLVHFIVACANNLISKEEAPTPFEKREDIWGFFARRYPYFLRNIFDCLVRKGLQKHLRFRRFFTEKPPKNPIKLQDRVD